MIAMLKVQYPGEDSPSRDAQAIAVVGRDPNVRGREIGPRVGPPRLRDTSSVRDLTWFDLHEGEFPLRDKLERLGFEVAMVIK